MSELINIPLNIDAQALLSGLHEIKQQMIEISKRAGSTEKEIQESFDKGSQEAQRYKQKLKEAVEAQKELTDATGKVKDATEGHNQASKNVDNLKRKTKEARSETEKLANSLETINAKIAARKDFLIRETDVAKIKQYKKEIQELQKEADKINKIGEEGEKKVSALGETAKKVGGFMAAAFAVDKIINFGRQIFQAAAQFQKFEAQLKTALGSKSAAQTALAMLSDFAKKTPYELTELTSSYIKFANRGLKLTTDELTKLGDLAASQGKSFDQLTEAVLDAGTGEFERLKEFGVKATQQGDKVTLMFKSQTVQVQKNEDAIQKAIIAMGSYKGVAGGMAEQSKTLGGQLANMQDNVSALAGAIGEKLAPVFGWALGGLNNFLEGLTSVFKSKMFEDVKQEINSQADAVINLNNVVVPMLSRYDELQTKAASLGGQTKLTKDEQEELGNIVSQVTAIMPDAANAWDEYGNVIGISTGKVRAMIEEQKNLLKYKNADLLKSVTKDVVAYQRAVDEAAERVKKSKNVIATGVDQFGYKLTKRELETEKSNLVSYGRMLKERNDILSGAKQRQEELNGDIIDKRIKQQAEERKLNEAQRIDAEYQKATLNIRAKGWQEEVAAENKAYQAKLKGYQDRAAIVNGDKKATEQVNKLIELETERHNEALVEINDKYSKKAKQESEKALRDRLQKIKEANDLERALAAARIDLLEAGRAKEIALENEKNRAAQADLKYRLITAAKGSQEEKALHELQELENKRHYKALGEISVKYIQEQEQLNREGNERLAALTLKGKEAELDQVSRAFDKEAAEINKKYKDNNSKRIALIVALAVDRANKEQAISEKYVLQSIEREEQLAILQIEGSIKNEEARNIAILQTRQRFAQLRLDQLNKNATAENEAERKGLENLIKSLGEQIDEKGRGFETIGQKIRKKLFDGLKNATGLDDKTIEHFINTLEAQVGQAVANMWSALTDGAEAAIAAKRQVIDELTSQIDEVEVQLARERDLQEAGYANNVDAKQKELDALKAQREKAQKEEQEAQKKRLALQKAQMAIDSISQVQNLITASTEIFKVMSHIPFVGVPLAIGLIASMFGAFTAAKVNAFKLAGAQKFADGGEVDGYSHSQGGNKYVSMDGRSKVLEIERGEYITNKKSTAKYKPILEAINNDELSNWSFANLQDFIDPKGARMSLEATEQANQLTREAKAIVFTPNINPRVENKLTDMEGHLKELVNLKKADGDGAKDMGDHYQIKKGSITRKIKK